jgi:hypothetical protein
MSPLTVTVVCVESAQVPVTTVYAFEAELSVES